MLFPSPLLLVPSSSLSSAPSVLRADFASPRVFIDVEVHLRDGGESRGGVRNRGVDLVSGVAVSGKNRESIRVLGVLQTSDAKGEGGGGL